MIIQIRRQSCSRLIESRGLYWICEQLLVALWDIRHQQEGFWLYTTILLHTALLFYLLVDEDNWANYVPEEKPGPGLLDWVWFQKEDLWKKRNFQARRGSCTGKSCTGHDSSLQLLSVEQSRTHFQWSLIHFYLLTLKVIEMTWNILSHWGM